MSDVRVYVPTTLSGLAQIVGDGGVGPGPIYVHAVTDALREGYPDGTEEDWEYVAMTAAARGALALLTEGEPPRRVVVVMDIDTVAPVGGGDPTAVAIEEVVSADRIVAVHVDSPDAEDDVGEARDAWEDAANGDEAALSTVDRGLEHELGWFAPQEIGDLLEL